MRILLIDTAFLGDMFLATPLIRAAAETGDGGQIDLLTSPAGSLVTANHPLVRSLYVMAKRGDDAGFGGFRRALAWVRSRHADVALLPRRSLRGALLAVLGGVPRRIGFQRRMLGLLLTDAVRFAEDQHQVERNLALLEPLGVVPASTGRAGHPLEAFPGAQEYTRVADWLAERGLHDGYVAVAPGSVWDTKRWPVERFADLASRLTANLNVVIIGGADEVPLARALRAGVSPDRRDRVHDATGRWAPTGTVALLQRAAVLVTNDSGALHIGQAAGVPIVGLFGPTAPSLGYAPRGEGHRVLGMDDLSCRPCGRHGARRCPLGHWRCMLDLSSARVEDAVRDILRAAA